MDSGTTTLIVLKALEGNSPPALNTLQMWIDPHVDIAIWIWRVLWVLTVVAVITVYIRAWRRARIR